MPRFSLSNYAANSVKTDRHTSLRVNYVYILQKHIINPLHAMKTCRGNGGITLLIPALQGLTSLTPLPLYLWE